MQSCRLLRYIQSDWPFFNKVSRHRKQNDAFYRIISRTPYTIPGPFIRVMCAQEELEAQLKEHSASAYQAAEATAMLDAVNAEKTALQVNFFHVLCMTVLHCTKFERPCTAGSAALAAMRCKKCCMKGYPDGEICL